MFIKEINIKKIVAACLVFCLIFSNCLTLFSSISFAESNELGKQQSEYVSNNVQYEAKFVKENEELGYKAEESIEEENLAIKINLEVKKEGYLKNARILIEAEEGLSFEISEESKEKFNLDENIINLNNVSAGDKKEIILPIRYKERDDIKNLNKKINVKLIGIYVNKSGNEKSISENIILNLVWNTNAEFNLSSSIKKYIPYTSEDKTGAIIQTSVKSGIPANNAYVNKEEIKIETMQIPGYKLDKVYVTSKSGLKENEWKYNEEENCIEIKIENKDEAIKSEEFFITYIFLGDKEIELPFKQTAKMNGSIFMFGTNEKSEDEINVEYEITEKLGDVITVEAKMAETVKLGNIIANKMNEEKEYKMNYEVEIASDISSNNLVEGIMIKDFGEEFENETSRFETKTSYYKTIKISKDNFEKILGADGEIEILNIKQEVISKINKDTKVDDDNNYIINIEGIENKINIKTTKPVSEGILIIKAEKEMTDSEYDINTLKTFSNLNLKYIGNVIYDNNVENTVSNIETKIKLEKPTTNANLKISRTALSTITENRDIQLTIELNNTNQDIDLYKNPNFIVTFPEYVENVEITNLAVANAEEIFTIKNNNLYLNNEGRIALNVSLEGTQTTYNTNSIANGTNIIINANIKLNLYTPSKTEKITMEYTNESATSYAKTANEIGYSEVEVDYKAPTGVVSVNKISNYNDIGTNLVSVAQGTVTDKIEIFDEAKVATMDILVMNNNENNCNNVRILGRIPFKGNKDVKTGEDLGTTVDTTLVSAINQSQENKAVATIYYSKNGEATDDLKDNKNEWTANPENLSEIKSYLIVLEGYEMNPGDILRYGYQYRIPENLEHNNNIYGSFETKYTNINDVATTEESSTPDLVGLTTGVGPQMNITTTTNVKEKVKEYEKIKYTITIENTGSEVINNAIVNTKIPTGATLAQHATQTSLQAAKGWTLKKDRELITKIDKINPGEGMKIEFFVQANRLNQNSDEEVKLICESTVSAQDLAKEMKTEDSGIIVEKSNLIAEETISSEESIAKVNETIEANIQIRNNSNETMRNIVVTKVLPEGLNYSESYIRGYEADGITIKKIKSSSYNPDTRTITWTIDELPADRMAIVIANIVVGEMEEGIYKNTISTISTINVNKEEYQAGQVDITVGRPSLVIEQSSNKTNQYVKVGDEIEYTFNIKNIGSVRANNVIFTDKLPDEVKINKLVYTVDGIEVAKVVAKNEDATVYTSILPQNELEVKITARVGDIDTKQKTIANSADVNAKTIKAIESNKVENIIERTTEQVQENQNQNTNNNKYNQITTNDKNNNNDTKPTIQNIKTSYEIKGTVWLDANKNGSRESSERKISGIEVKLVNSKTGKQIEKVVTTTDGEYKFTNLENGEYIAIFYYDNDRYAITDYKKQGIGASTNSDVMTATEGNRNIATTDRLVINNGSISNIDMGLVEASTFDLKLTKSVTKVTVQTAQGTKSYDFNHSELAKVDINGKYMDGAKLIVEYAFTIKNEGEIEGYAKKLVDYMPKELEFSTELNKNWYIGSDGNLYNDQLANTAIAAGTSKEVKLVLTRNMTENSAGIVNNQAKISESYNKAGIENENSKDAIASADLIIGVSTGDTLIYISAIIVIVIAGLIAAVVIKKKKLILRIQLKLRKEA